MAFNLQEGIKNFAQRIKESRDKKKTPGTSYDKRNPDIAPNYEVPEVLAQQFQKQRDLLGEQKAGALASGRKAFQQRLALQGLGGSGAGLKAEAQLQSDVSGQERQALQQIGQQEAQTAYQHGITQQGFELQKQQLDIAWQELDVSKQNSIYNQAQIIANTKKKRLPQVQDFLDQQFSGIGAKSPNVSRGQLVKNYNGIKIDAYGNRVR